MKRSVCLLILSIAIYSMMANTAPEIFNFSAAQRTDGSKTVDLYYDIADADTNMVSIGVELSEDNGTTWDVILSTLGGDIGDNIEPGTNKHITWLAGDEAETYEGTLFRFRLSAADSLETTQEISGLVTLDTVDPQVSVISPNGGEFYRVGNTHAIEWTATDFGLPSDAITIQFSANNGATYSDLANSMANSGSFDWQIPFTLTDDGLIRINVTDNFGNEAEDTSDNPFEIDVHYVPDDFPTIQSAIDAAVDGNVIVLQNGVYYENLAIEGKEIALASRFILDGNPNHIDLTIIDGSTPSDTLNASVIKMLAGSNPDAVPYIYGLTIQGGSGTFNASLDKKLGGGFYIEGLNPIITGNKVKDNQGVDEGGGAYALNGHPNFGGDIENAGIWNLQFNPGTNVFYQNVAGYGRTIFIEGATDVLKAEHCHFDVYSTVYQDVPEFWAYTDGESSFLYGSGDREAIISDAYISVYGDDNNIGSTQMLPFQHISRAYRDIYATENNIVTIHLAPGTYAPSTTGESFPITPMDYIIIEGSTTREETIIDIEGSAETPRSGFYISDKNYVALKNMTIRGGNTSGIDGIGSAITKKTSRMDLFNCEFIDNTGLIQAIYSYQPYPLNFPDSLVLDRCFFQSNTMDTATSYCSIYSNYSVLEVNNCYFSNLQGIEFNGPDFHGNSGRTYFKNSVFIGLAFGYRNIVSPNYYNCTFYDHDEFGGDWWGGFSNCVFHGDNEKHIEFGFESVYWDISRNNCIHGYTYSSTNHAYGIINSVNANGVPCDIYGNIFMDPQLVDAPNDLSLASTSTCIDAGTPDSLDLYLPQYDITGSPRLYGSSIDIGAYENQGLPSGDAHIDAGPGSQHIFSTNLDPYETEIQILSIGNTGSTPLYYTVTLTPSSEFNWVLLNGTSTTVTSKINDGEPIEDIEIVFSTEHLMIEAGHYETILRIVSNDADFPVIEYNVEMDIDSSVDVDPDSFELYLVQEQTQTVPLILTNLGNTLVNYNLDFLNRAEENEIRSIEGSYMECSESTFLPGEAATWHLTAYNASDDNEWLENIMIDLPEGVTIYLASNFVGGSGGDLEYDGTTGNGVEVNWHGETSNGWGLIHGGEIANTAINISIDPDYTGDIAISYQLDGDVYGNEPHVSTGIIEIENIGSDASWITANPTSGTIEPYDTSQIDVMLDASGLENGEYNANIVVSDGRFIHSAIPVTLYVGDSALELPANIALENDGSEVVISWDAIADASSYRVYAGDIPSEAIIDVSGEGSFSEADGRVSWAFTGDIESKKFFLIKAVYFE